MDLHWTKENIKMESVKLVGPMENLKDHQIGR